MTKDQLLELLHDSIPQPERITCVDTHAKDAVKFCWRGMSFTVTTSPKITGTGTVSACIEPLGLNFEGKENGNTKTAT